MNKVRAGYKMTELGEIPIEWEVKRLEECTNKITDGSHTSPAPVEISNYKICTVANMKKYKLDLENSTNISEEDYIRLIKNGCSAERGDVLLSKDGTVGKTLVYSQSGENIVFLSSIAIIRPQKNILLGEYLNQYLQETRTLERLSNTKTGSAIKRIVLKDIKNIKIIIPKIQEQEKIASILSTVDEQIDNVDALIEKNKELKKGLMQTLLTKGIGHTKFKRSEIGEIPEEWELESMNKIVTSTQLGTNTLGKENEKIPMLKMGNLTIGGFDFNKLEYISEEELEMNKEYILSNGDFLFNTRNTLELVGKSAVWNSQIDKAIFNSNIMRIKYCSKINDFYMGYYFSSDIGWKQLKSISTGTTSVAAIYTKDLMKIKVIIPSIGEQEKIVSILLEVDKKIEEYENKKQKLEELKKGLMQQLLTGMIRVTV